jgi:hypothetical protein
MKMYPKNEGVYAGGRIANSVVLCGGALIEVYSTYVGGDGLIEMVCLDNGLNTKDHLHLKGQDFILGVDHSNGGKVGLFPLAMLDISPVRLGYINYMGDTFYIVRTPMRNDWRQGFRHGSLMQVSDSGNHQPNLPYGNMSDTIHNKFPTFYECLDEVGNPDNDTVGMAWHRDWSLGPNDTVYNKGRVVGLIRHGSVWLDKEFVYLQESLDEIG